jgi:hypothetical protein
VNFLSVDDAESWEPFCKTADAQDLLKSEGFSHFEDNEADRFFDDHEIARKEKRIVNKLWEGRMLHQVDIEYIAQKK